MGRFGESATLCVAVAVAFATAGCSRTGRGGGVEAPDAFLSGDAFVAGNAGTDASASVAGDAGTGTGPSDAVKAADPVAVDAACMQKCMEACQTVAAKSAPKGTGKAAVAAPAGKPVWYCTSLAGEAGRCK